MLRASISFFMIAILAIILGANNLAGLSMEIGKMILGIFLILSLVSFLFTVNTSRKNKNQIKFSI